jgi:hypothetical protein
LNKVWDHADLIEDRFSRGYAKTVVPSCFQRGDCACGVGVEKKRLTISTLSIKHLQMFTDLFNAIAFANASTAGQVTSTQQMMEML